MRPIIFLSSAALLLAAVAGPQLLARSTLAEPSVSAIAACAQMGADWAAGQGDGCSQPSPDSTPGTVLNHAVFAGGCGRADLHVLRYVPANAPGSNTLVATWCA